MQNNSITISTPGPQPDEFKITCKTGRRRQRARALEMALKKYGYYSPGEGWRKVINPAPTDIVAHLEKLSRALETPKPPQKLKRVICLVDNGLDASYKGPIYKIALYVLAAFEHDPRPWYFGHNETVEEWDDRRHRRFRALMCALGFERFYKFRKGDRPTPEELYCGRLLAADLGLSALAAYADIFGGARADLAEADILYHGAITRDAMTA